MYCPDIPSHTEDYVKGTDLALTTYIRGVLQSYFKVVTALQSDSEYSREVVVLL